MGRYAVLAKVAKPYALKDGDVVMAQPGRELVIGDHLDGSMSIVKGCNSKLLTKIEATKVIVVEPASVVVPISPVAEAAHAAVEVVEEKLAPVSEAEPAKDSDVSESAEDGETENGSGSRPSGTKRKWQNKGR